MRSVVTWSDRLPDRDGIKSVVNDLCFRPDGAQVIAAVGNRVLVYDAVDGDLLHSLKGHKDTVYTVSYSRDGKRFASGGADNTIIIWTHQAEGILKYCHNDAIQKLAYNPVTQQLASATCADFGLWSPEKKSVAKHKVKDRVLTAAWTNDGQYLALGLFNGCITIRDKAGADYVTIRRSAPVWSICWNPSRDETSILAVACWDRTLSFYQLTGDQVGKDREVQYDPCALAYFTQGEYLLMGGSDKKVTLHTKEGVRLVTIGERDGWVWCTAARPKQNYVAVGSNDGTITMYQLIFSTVHGLYQDRYAYRENMTDVIIQHLITEQKVRIKCRDYVKKIAVYKDRLAVQLPDRVIIYELTHDDDYDMHYRVKEKLQERLECNLIVVTAMHIILCQEKKLQLYSFGGTKDREWVLDSVIRYIKVVGGPTGREGLLVGLKSGMVYKIFIDNPFPIQLIKHQTSIRCLDLSATRAKLAIVDENTSVLVYDVKSKELIFQDTNANSVAFNTEMEDMYCYSGNGMLNIKTGKFPKHSQKLQGFVVGFKGSKIFCLHYVSMQTIDVPQSASLYRYVEKKDWENAYKVACLGVTESDWRHLATEALAAMSFEYARMAFIRIRDMRFIELLNQIETKKRQDPSKSDEFFLGDIHAYQGRFQEAAKSFQKTGQITKAVEMWSDLRKWDEASSFASKHDGAAAGVNIEELIRKQATYSEENDPRAAAEMYIACGETVRAIKLCGENGLDDKLIEIVRTLDKTATSSLSMAAGFFRKNGNHQCAKEVYVKMEDVKSLIDIHVELQMWDDALALLQSNPEHRERVYLAYGNWLAENDRFDDAQKAFDDAGRPDLSSQLLEQLTHNAVLENRFNDASYYFWLLSQEHLRQMEHCTVNSPAEMTAKHRRHWQQAQELLQRSEMYFAFHHVYRYTDEPFTSLVPDALFNISRFIMSSIKSREAPLGVSKIYTLFCLAKQARTLAAYKLARYCLDRLQHLHIPAAWREQIDFASITIRSLPFLDKEELMPVCYRCATTNPLLTTHCVSCGHEFIRSFCSFDILPLVEFSFDKSISTEEAARLIRDDSGVKPSGRGNNRSRSAGDDWRQSHGTGFERMEMDDGAAGGHGVNGAGGSGNDLFTVQLMSGDPSEVSGPVRVDRATLASLSSQDVFCVKQGKSGLRPRYFKTMVPDIPIVLCNRCNHFFHEEDFEFATLQKKECPFCKLPVDENFGKQLLE